MHNEELCTLQQILQGDQIKEDKMGGTYNMHGKDENNVEHLNPET
jgi:hypothetical protein